MGSYKAMALSDLDATNLELEQAALQHSIMDNGELKQQALPNGASTASNRRRRPLPTSSPTTPPAVASLPRAPAVASAPVAAAAARPASAVLPEEEDSTIERPRNPEDYPQSVQDMIMNGFDPAKVVRAYDLVGDNFDQMLMFLLSSSAT